MADVDNGRGLLPCAGCGQLVARWMSRVRDKSRVYCSNKCQMRMWWSTHEKKTYPPSDAARERKTIRQAIRQAFTVELTRQVHAQQPCRICGLPLGVSHKNQQIHAACLSEQKRSSQRTYQRMKRAERHPLNHVCPACGEVFATTNHHRVHCSRRCQHRMHHHGRYPAIGVIPLNQRNQVAELTALVRAAQRRIDQSRKSLI
jgi:endogenous inhibitor of DNA gyrase (YacG/DUF329 family)